MELQGRIYKIGETQQVTDSYKKRDLVIKTDEQYPQFINIEFAQDKTSLLDNRIVGEEVKVSINIGGREWVNPQGETKYFNSIKGWRIEKIGENNTPAQQQAQEIPTMTAGNVTTHTANPTPATDFKEEEHDDLPF